MTGADKIVMTALALFLLTTAAFAADGFDCPGNPDCPPIPNEAMKARALKRAWELNGNRMCCGFIDVSQDPVVVEAPALLKGGRNVITPETEYNVLDAQVIKAGPEADVCKKHGLHKVVYGDKWRCRK